MCGKEIPDLSGGKDGSVSHRRGKTVPPVRWLSSGERGASPLVSLSLTPLSPAHCQPKPSARSPQPTTKVTSHSLNSSDNVRTTSPSPPHSSFPVINSPVIALPRRPRRRPRPVRSPDQHSIVDASWNPDATRQHPPFHPSPHPHPSPTSTTTC